MWWRTVVVAGNVAKGSSVWFRTVWVAGTVMIVSACADEGMLAPELEGETTVGFSEPISLSQLEDATTSPTRVEVKLLSGTAPLVARELEIEEPQELSHREEIESRVREIQRRSDGATLVLDIDGLSVDVGASARFRDESSSGDLTMAAALDRLQASLNAGDRPSVELKRPAPASPQDPNDPSFVATELRINDESSEPKLEINVDGDNFDFTAAASGQGTLRVLGLEIVLDAASGRTELERESEDASGEVDFEGLVTEADASAGTVTLASGLIIRVVQGTEIETGSGGSQHLASVAAVAEALAGGALVEAEGEGVHEGPGMLVATEVEFEVEDEVEDIPGAREFEGQVTAVSPGNRTFTLASGVVLTLGEGVAFDPDGDVHSLQAMADAVAAGSPVRAEGHAVPTADGQALVVVEVKAEIDD